MAELNMVSYKLQDLQFFNKLDKPGQVQLENNFSFSVSYTPDNTRCVAGPPLLCVCGHHRRVRHYRDGHR